MRIKTLILSIFLSLTIIACGHVASNDDIIPTVKTPLSEENATMFVTIQLTQDAASNLRQQSQPSAEVSEILQIAADLGVTLEPMHPSVSSDSVLGTYFTVPVVDAAQGEAIAQQFQQAAAVEAAYFKPPGSPPTD